MPGASKGALRGINMSKVWFITGSGSGIGAGTARAALRAGDRVIATGRNLDKLRRAYRDVAGDNLVLERLDVTSETEARRVTDAAVTRFGRIDVLVNNAGYSLLGNFEELTTEQIARQFEPNFWGVVHVMRAVLPIMRGQRSGHIINISSVAGVVGQAAVAAYGASKFAVEGLSLAVAREVERFGIKVTVVEPGVLPDWPPRPIVGRVEQRAHRGLRACGEHRGRVVGVRRSTTQ